MIKRIFLAAAYLNIILSPVYAASTLAPAFQVAQIDYLEPITKQDRILILAPHPDDEAIGCAGVIQSAVKAGAFVSVAYLTNGDHNQFAFIVYEKRLTFRTGEFIHMGEVRKQEAIKAMQLLGLKRDNLVFLGYPDFGTFAIFKDYWQAEASYKSILTRISRVPYKDDLTFGAPYVGESILSDLKSVLKKYKPNKIFVSSPMDVNVDHKALYLFLQVALSDLEKDLSRPKIYPFLIHSVGWPLPRYYHPDLELFPPKQFFDSSIHWLKYELTPRQLHKKYSDILCYRSQTQSAAFYLLSFARKNELFGNYNEIQLVMPTLTDAMDPSQDLGFKDRLAAFLGLSQAFKEKTAEMIEQGEEAEGNSKVKYSVDKDFFVIRVTKTKENARNISTLIYLFGYNFKIPFQAMPKLTIVTRYNKIKVLESKKSVLKSGVKLEHAPGELIIMVPLKLLEGPDYVLSSVKAYTGTPPVQATGFRKIILRRR